MAAVVAQLLLFGAAPVDPQRPLREAGRHLGPRLQEKVDPLLLVESADARHHPTGARRRLLGVPRQRVGHDVEVVEPLVDPPVRVLPGERKQAVHVPVVPLDSSEPGGPPGLLERFVGHPHHVQARGIGHSHPLHRPHLGDDDHPAGCRGLQQVGQYGRVSASGRFPAGPPQARPHVEPVAEPPGRPQGRGSGRVQGGRGIGRLPDLLDDIGGGDSHHVHAVAPVGEEAGHAVRPARDTAQLVDAVGDQEQVTSPFGSAVHRRPSWRKNRSTMARAAVPVS